MGGCASDVAQDGRAFDVLRYILLQASAQHQERWVPEIRETALSVYRSMSPLFAVQQSMNLLSEFPERDDLHVIICAICTWPKEVYAQSKPFAWLQGMKRKGYGFEVQRALFERLAEAAPDAESVERIKECLEQLRRN